jgi:organic radical activating enzyme
LRCNYCDTPYTWDFERFDVKREITSLDVASVLERLRAAPLERLVITGGEPLLQQAAIARLLDELAPSLPVEVETNGTIAPTDELWRRVTQWNVSPKLAFSGMPRDERLIMPALAAFARSDRAYLKLVVAQPTDMQEGDTLIAELAWPSERVVWMPEGTSAQRLALRGRWVAEQALERGQRFSVRLHVLLWGDQRGR